MKINKEYIEGFLTPNGGYTKDSLKALGVDWPPPKGWKKKLIEDAKNQDMGNVTNLKGFFNPDLDKSIPVTKRRHGKKRKKQARFDNVREKVLRHLGLNEKSSLMGVCFCIYKETEWPIPGNARDCREYIRKYYRKIRNKPRKWLPKKDDDFYNTKRWKELRFVALRMAEGRCELCGARASDGVQLHADHVKPRSKYPELQWDLDNLQILCEDCNYGKSNYDDTDYRRW